MLREIESIPEGLYDCKPEQLLDVLSAPTLIHLQGRQRQPLFVSIMLHGNEPTGLYAMQAILHKYRDAALPRSLSLFVGNVYAARKNMRRLPRQPDYNRIWPPTPETVGPETRMLARVVDSMVERGVYASIDIHNNTGLNPHYACINRTEFRFLQLASLFSRTVVQFEQPAGVQTMAFAPHCPAVTLECGKPGEIRARQHAADYVDACLHLSEIPDHPLADRDIDLFHTVARIRLREGSSFSFGPSNADVCFLEDLDHLNFRELPAGTILGEVKPRVPSVIEVRNAQGEDLTEHFFSVQNHHLVLNRQAMPSMLTLDCEVIRQDCLCYLMERL